MAYHEEKNEPITGEEQQASVEHDEEAGPASTDETLLNELKQGLAAEKERAEASLAGWQRAAADLSNYRKRSEQERSELVKNANADLIRRLLPVIDDMERAFQTVPADLAPLPWVEGMRLIERKLLTILEQEGVTPYDALGLEFDPAFHEAVTLEATDAANDGKVIGEIQKGYRLRDRVLRPALVRVGKGR
jgi:molecular chaperone GrpE